MKLLPVGAEETVAGLNAIGENVEEKIPGFAVAIKMAATKEEFHNTVELNLTGSEENGAMR
ncbi:hypothetical protein [Streptococcus hyointestinalis]|uniref:hypothetical protein n=1 Tax=Streptococcus hyointestinalis TaxID=1337 RepID=UPI0013DF9530|nr:hypothetical protein [Streptococcus hyointestinalis]